MKGTPEIIELLNELLAAELAGINQFFGHYKILENWGYLRLARQKRHESIREMRHAEEVIGRILLLEGMPNMQRLHPVRLGEDPVEMHRADLAFAAETVARLNQGIALAREKADNGTRLLLESILEKEEECADWLETQLHLVEQLGAERYLAEQLEGDD